jgi:hypothetical protein
MEHGFGGGEIGHGGLPGTRSFRFEVLESYIPPRNELSRCVTKFDEWRASPCD